MTTQEYQEIITESIKGLPEDTLAEIAHFVFFMRKKVLEPKAFEDELWAKMIEIELKQLSRDEETHLEQEFADYDQTIR
jgi:hypothetical protein